MTFPCARALLRHWPLPCLIVALALTHLSYADDAKPAAAPSDAPYAPRLTEIEQKIDAALAKTVNLNYIDTPLKDIVADLAKQVDLPISISEAGLDEAGVVATEAMTLDVGNVSLRESLRLLNILHRLGYVPTTTGLRIVSVEMMEERPIVRTYPVHDLIPKLADEVDELKEPRGAFCAFSENDMLIDLITSHLASDSWTHSGGSATIRGYQGQLVVSHSLPEHYELAQILSAYRKVQRDDASAKSGAVGPVVSARNTSKVREALNKRDSSSIDMELKWYVRDVSKLTGVPVVLDPRGLEEAGVTADTFIRATYRDAKVGDILRQVLEEHNLALALFEEYVVVTSEESAYEIGPETWFYPVHDVIGSDQEMLDFDSLIDLITSTVIPDSWVDNGGGGAIQSITNPPALVVSVTDDVHAGIEKLLADLRANGAGKVRDAKQKPADRIVQKIYPLYVARRELQAKMALKKDEPEKVEEKKSQAATTPSPGENKVMPQFAAANAGGITGFGSSGPTTSGLGGMGGTLLPPNRQVADPVPSSEDVAKLIKELLPDDSWQEEGVLLRPFYDVLIIRQRPAMHRKIERLLRDIDAWHGEAYNLLPIGWH